MPEAQHTFLKTPDNVTRPITILNSKPFYRGFEPKALWKTDLPQDPLLQVVDYEKLHYSADELIQFFTGQEIMPLGTAQSLFGTTYTYPSYTVGMKWQIAKSVGLPVPTNSYQVDENKLAFTDPTNFGTNTVCGYYESQALLEQDPLSYFYSPQQIEQLRAVNMDEVAQRAYEIADIASSAHLLLEGDESMFDLVVTPQNTWSISMMGFHTLEDASHRKSDEVGQFNRNKMLLFVSSLRTVQGFIANGT
jgi:hypothetical protein